MTSDFSSPVRGRPILGAIAGLLLGIGVSLDLRMFGVISLDSVLVVALTPAMLVLGGIIGAIHPLGFLRRG
ncbi:MAG: hypothetical protein EXR66_01240 [Dehalococcoidia bacterium]|nr:hypothetical protein [Dehalococcoidia bacterium]